MSNEKLERSGNPVPAGRDVGNVVRISLLELTKALKLGKIDKL
jgi:hypothetical protein